MLDWRLLSPASALDYFHRYQTGHRVMSMHLIPPALADIGRTLFGENWRTPLANSLEVTEDQITAWLQDPASMPTDLEARFEKIGRTRIEDISFMLGQMANTGLDRSRK